MTTSTPTTSRTLRYLLCTAMGVLGLACVDTDDDQGSSGGGDVGGPSPLPDDEDTDDGAASDGADGADGADGNNDSAMPPSDECTFHFENAIVFDGYGLDIYYLYVSPSDSPSWGNDQLGANILPYGETLALQHVPLGEYDVRVVDEDEDTYSRYGIVCDGSDWSWTIHLSDLD